jgi:hypothetical protein
VFTKYFPILFLGLVASLYPRRPFFEFDRFTFYYLKIIGIGIHFFFHSKKPAWAKLPGIGL